MFKYLPYHFSPLGVFNMKLISWNVNGIRSVLGKGFLDFVDSEKPDILCLQETKAQPEQVNLVLQGYQPIWNSAQKKGYSGTSIFTRIPPQGIQLDMGIAEHDQEGRIIVADFGDFYLLNVYTPNAQRELTRLEYRMKWDKDFLAYLQSLNTKKPVIFCGDLNVAHQEIDLANPKSNRRNAGFTDEERAGFSSILAGGFVDTFREFSKEGGKYTWWSYMFNARAKNVGWRIDYFCVSERFVPRVKSSEILASVMGSDHCPVRIEIV